MLARTTDCQPHPSAVSLPPGGALTLPAERRVHIDVQPSSEDGVRKTEIVIPGVSQLTCLFITKKELDLSGTRLGDTLVLSGHCDS